jgi:tripartite-type tricarboxylate transporter receptor subunit TctC
MRSTCLAIIAAFLSVATVPAAAETNYPEKNIRLIFGFPPGSDFATRILANKLSEAFGKPVLVENVTGAAGNIAADRVTKAVPDGYTIGILPNSNIVINASLYRQLSFGPVKELIPITQLFGYPNLLVVNNDAPVKSVQELVALARRKPGKLTYGHSGLGTTQHLSGELMKLMARIDVQEVAYRGPPQILTDLIGGQIAMSFISPSNSLPLIRQGKIRALAVTSPQRTSFASDLPTMNESGFTGFDVTAWFGVFAPAGTPASIIEKLSRETAMVMALPDVHAKLLDVGYVPLSNTPAEFGEIIKAETTYWARLLKELRIQRIE